jgi:hypothetical protein
MVMLLIPDMGALIGGRAYVVVLEVGTQDAPAELADIRDDE